MSTITKTLATISQLPRPRPVWSQIEAVAQQRLASALNRAKRPSLIDGRQPDEQTRDATTRYRQTDHTRGRQNFATNEFFVLRVDSEVPEADSGRTSDDVMREMRRRQYIGDDRQPFL